MTACPVCAGSRWTRLRFVPFGGPDVVMILSRCDGCGLHGFRPRTDDADARPVPDRPAVGETVRWDQSLEACLDPVAELQRSGAHLRPGSAILITVADAGSPGARWLGGAWPGWEPGRQRWIFDAPALRAAIERAGLAAAYVRRAPLHGLLMARAERP